MDTPRTDRARRAGLLSVIVLALAAHAPRAAAQQPAPAPADNEYQVGSILWTQQAGEWRALAYQAFALARLRLDEDLRKNKKKKPQRAVVVDVDETVLDNSPQQAYLVKQRKAFNQPDWAAWVARAEAAALPGAVEFLRYAASKGVRVFYVTNRSEAERAGTAENLNRLGFPTADKETLLLRADASSKEARRQAVAAQYRIVLLLGDNLNDFAEVFEKKTVSERLAAVEQNRDQFGARFIVLPNAMYGDWENAIYQGLAPGETRTQRRHDTLKAAPLQQ
ncbi:MAG TPA: 5'-nucleotidase, lipoprotein e(P4) family [Pyrinomonadaceae bacterium]|jgi:5'-nucleotidase (lipoprotein e(P4) family)